LNKRSAATRLSASFMDAAGGEATGAGVEAGADCARAAGGTANAALATPAAAASTGTNAREERADSAGDRLNLDVLFCRHRIGRSQLTVCIFLKSDFPPNATRFSTTNVATPLSPPVLPARRLHAVTVDSACRPGLGVERPFRPNR
jgi:hypothetical protein